PRPRRVRDREREGWARRWLPRGGAGARRRPRPRRARLVRGDARDRHRARRECRARRAPRLHAAGRRVGFGSLLPARHRDRALRARRRGARGAGRAWSRRHGRHGVRRPDHHRTRDRDTVTAWVERDAAVVWHGFTQMSAYVDNAPVIVERADGHYVYDTDGKRYFD